MYICSYVNSVYNSGVCIHFYKYTRIKRKIDAYIGIFWNNFYNNMPAWRYALLPYWWDQKVFVGSIQSRFAV